MSDEITEEQKDILSNLLSKLEGRTELEACAVVTKEGLRIACAVSGEVDADVYSAASAALVNLGETSLRQLKHGSLKEIIVRGDDGYTILTQAGPHHMVVGSCRKLSRMGYYLALLHRFSNKVAQTLGFEPQPPTEIERPTKPVATKIAPAAKVSKYTPPTPVSMEEIPEPLFVEEEFARPVSVEKIPAPATISEGEESFDKKTLFDALRALETHETPSKMEPTPQGVEIDSEALRSALSPKTAKTTPTTGKKPVRPFATAETSEDELFKISDKDAVLEALKVLGWEEPEEDKKKK